ncbi:DUF3800 domain-containing protein [Agrobacterium tumefaciens]|uniref:DUF3800 domain-containing protein n=1 Tax=Agrobacterium tumefaciens TaxID=358 RepID=UPI0015728ABC|nr:DUF3800 domain-containing protein [Agrobacterium tumefaciens]NSZ61852.1 DUF3800 domain-containing protein [Agrobacterium tumefaciens]NTA68224.1 DUF3800 domain-containing protein [Agrobacterium tumefaciens]WIE38063.1 DUF3800 domain-containing protein [Agrobacterium tumefaciens]
MTAKYKKYSIFVDESSQTKHKFLTLGCLVVEEELVKPLEFSVKHARALEISAGGEMKWAKVSGLKLHAYKLFIDRFFDLTGAADRIHFHSIAIDTSKIKDDLYNAGSREIGFNKEVYQLLIKCARLYPNGIFRVYADYRDTTFSMDELRKILNNGLKKRGDARPMPFRDVQFCDSKKFVLIQMTDLLLGAATFHINGHHEKPEASKHKCHLSKYVLERAGVMDAMKGTSPHGKFTIWHRKLR